MKTWVAWLGWGLAVALAGVLAVAGRYSYSKVRGGAGGEVLMRHDRWTGRTWRNVFGITDWCLVGEEVPPWQSHSQASRRDR